MEKVIVEQIISFKRERRPWLQPSRSRQAWTPRCQQLKINKILSAPNLLGHILVAVLLPREGWGRWTLPVGLPTLKIQAVRQSASIGKTHSYGSIEQWLLLEWVLRLHFNAASQLASVIMNHCGHQLIWIL